MEGAPQQWEARSAEWARMKAAGACCEPSASSRPDSTTMVTSQRRAALPVSRLRRPVKTSAVRSAAAPSEPVRAQVALQQRPAGDVRDVAHRLPAIMPVAAPAPLDEKLKLGT